MQDFAPITYQFFEAFATERRHWEITEDTGAFAAIHKPSVAVNDNPMDAQYEVMACTSREQAAHYIGLRCTHAALVACSLLFEDDGK